MLPPKITAGHKNQKMLHQAYLHAKVVESFEELFNQNYPEFITDLQATLIISKKTETNLKITLKSQNIQFLSWLESQNISQSLSSILESKNLLQENETLKLIYKTI